MQSPKFYKKVRLHCPLRESTRGLLRITIQGDYEQGILLTTSRFPPEALAASTKKGAVPIIPIDGSMIVDIMIEKKFGIDVEQIPVYINALDVVLNED